MQTGGPAEFRDFVAFRLPFARWSARRWHLSLGLDLDEAEQLAVIGLLRAARRFRPELGVLFATYAFHWLRCVFQTLGPQAALLIQVPGHLFWECRAPRRKLDRPLLADGPGAARRLEMEVELFNQRFARRGFCAQRALQVSSLSDRTQPEFRQARLIPDPDPESDPGESAGLPDSSSPVRDAIARLHERQARVLRLRFGFEGTPLTLAAIAVWLR